MVKKKFSELNGAGGADKRGVQMNMSVDSAQISESGVATKPEQESRELRSRIRKYEKNGR